MEAVYAKRVTSFGNNAKVGAPKAYIGRRAYVISSKDDYEFCPKAIGTQRFI